MLCKNKASSSDSIQKYNETTNKMLMKGTWVAKSIAGWTPFKSIQRRKRQLVKRNNQHNHYILFFIFLLNTKKSKNYTLKKIVGVWVWNLKVENATWSQLSVLYKIKTRSKLIKKEQKQNS